MKRIVMGVGVLLGAALVGCTGGVNTTGQTPEEAGQQIADHVCARAAGCGKVHLDCTAGSTGALTCEGEIQPTTTAECLEDAPAAFTSIVMNADANGVSRAELDACVNSLLGESCITQAELDAYLASLNAGMSGARLREPTPECAAIGVVYGG